MRPLLGLVAICLAPLSAQVWYSPRLQVNSPSDLDQRLHAPFAEGAAHPAGVSNCAQLLERRGPAPQKHGSDREIQEQRSTMADCLVLQELRGAKPPRVSHLRELVWDEHVLPLLPPQLAITVSAESQRAAAVAANHGRTWTAVDPSITAATRTPGTLLVSGTGFREQLILWGRGDFTGDGLEDLLVESLDTLTEGTYRNIRLFVLTRKSPKGRLLLVRSLL